VDLVKVSASENKVLKPTGTIGDLGIIIGTCNLLQVAFFFFFFFFFFLTTRWACFALLGMSITVTPDFVLLYTLYDTLEVYCYAVNPNTYLRTPHANTDSVTTSAHTAPQLRTNVRWVFLFLVNNDLN